MMTLPCWPYRKNRAILLVLYFTVLFSSFADLVIHNNTRGVLYFALVPIQGDRPPLEKEEEAKAFLREKATTLESLPPEAFISQPTSPAPYLLLGFIVSPDRPIYALIRAQLPLIPGRPTFTIGEQDIWKNVAGQAYGLYPWELTLSTSPIQIDNRYLDWRNIKEIQQFPSSFVPLKAFRYQNRKPQEIPFPNSSVWPSKGTAVETIKIAKGEKDVYVMLSSYSPLDKGTSFWFYFKGPMAVEIPILGKGGPILLWLPSRDQPVHIGVYAADLFMLEGQMQGKRLPQEAWELLDNTQEVILSVSASGKEGAEEYYLSRIPLDSIP
ncbi:MAG: hypothetical protein SNJ78_11835 [Spirochaetales bacterium]